MKKIILLPILVLFIMCKTDQKIVSDVKASAPLIIYKTKADYSNKVPIIMNDKKDMIVSYPSPKDIYLNGKLALPVKLKHGYYLDNRGISTNSVFTSYTYEEYSKLATAPKLEELMDRIIDKDPFLEIYDCGVREKFKKQSDIIKLVNFKFTNCMRLK
jgi:hypothetical protein